MNGIVYYAIGAVVVGGIFAGLWWNEDYAPGSMLVAVFWPLALPAMLCWLIGRGLSAKMRPVPVPGKTED